MTNKAFQVEIDERVSEDAIRISTGLENLALMAADSCDFTELFSNAISLLYQQLPNGVRNYGGKNPRIGKIYADNNSGNPGKLDLMFTHSGYKHSYLRLVQINIAEIDLRFRTAELEWKPGHYRRKNRIQVPAQLRRDSEFILPRLGLNLKGPSNQ